MDATTIFSANEPNVASEEIDDEIIIVNLLTGSYYSTTDVGAYVWKQIADGQTVSSVVDHLTDRFAGNGETIELDIIEFVEKLSQQELIRVSDGRPADGHATNRDQSSRPLPETYSEPVLNCYTDMKDLLLLDPVHDVEDAGWPSAKHTTTA